MGRAGADAGWFGPGGPGQAGIVLITRHNPPEAPAVRRYSQVVRVALAEATLLFISGVVSVDRDGQLVGRDSLSEQADQVYANLSAILASQGAGLTDVVKTTTFLTAGVDPSPLRGRPRFPDHALPASTAVVVTALADPEWLIEVEAIAVVAGGAAPGGPRGTAQRRVTDREDRAGGPPGR